MKKQVLVIFINHLIESGTEYDHKRLFPLLETMLLDETLPEVVTITDFTSDKYSVREIRWIKQILSFKLY